MHDLQGPHIVLAIIATTETPLVSQLADVADGLIYLAEGEPGEAMLSFAGLILTSAIVTKTAGKVIMSFKNLRKLENGKFVDVAIDNLQAYSKTLEMSEEQALRLNSVLTKNPVMAQLVVDNPKALGAMKFLEDAKFMDFKNEISEESMTLISHLADDLGSVNGLDNFLKNNPEHGTLAWKYADDAFPNNPSNIFCFL